MSPLRMSVTCRGIPSHLPGSAAVASQKVCDGALLSNLLATVSSCQIVHSVSHHPKICGEAEQRGTCSVETRNHLELAKLNAEEAASVATAAVGQSHAIWDQLCCKKNSGLISDHEAKLASSAAVAAATLAGAAAAAAKLAYEATMQAKHCAEEALSSNITTDVNQFGEIESCEDSLRKTTPTTASILKGKEKDASSNWQMNQNFHSSYPASRDSLKQNGQGTSSIIKTAQDLDAIVRASELVEEVVSQARAVVAMGDPSPWKMDNLLDADSNGYFKVMNQGCHGHEKPDIIHNEVPFPEKKSTAISEKPVELVCVKEQIEVCKNEIPGKIENTEESSKESSLSKGGEVHTLGGLHCDIISIKKHAEDEKENFVLKDVQTNAFVTQPETTLRGKNAIPETEHGIEMMNDVQLPGTTQIKEGSLVEVVSNEGGIQKAWVSAKVLSLKNGKAFVNYDRLFSHKGPDQLQEWVSLEQESGKTPVIRLAHPLTTFKFEGVQKRQRAAMSNHVWSLGDHVDAWIHYGWWEGIVTVKNEDDEDTVTIHFPGEDNTATIKSFNVRPSLAWVDGQWVLWTDLKPTMKGTCEDYLPVRKRQKLYKVGSTEVQHLNTMSSSVNSYKSFLVGESLVETGRSANSKGKKGTRERESSGLAVGVSKLENKRELMGVSKHPVSKISKNAYGGNIRTKPNQFKALGQGREKTIKAVEYKKDRPMIPRPKDSKPEKKAQRRQDKIKTGKDKSYVVKPKATKEPLCDGLLLSAIPSANKDSSQECSNGVRGHPPDGQQPVDISSLSVSKKVAISRTLHSTIISTSLATVPLQGSKGQLSTTVDCSQDAGASAVRKIAAKGKDPGETTTKTMGLHKSTQRIQPISQLLQGGQRPPRIVKSPLGISFSGMKGKDSTESSNSMSKGDAAG